MWAKEVPCKHLPLQIPLQNTKIPSNKRYISLKVESKIEYSEHFNETIAKMRGLFLLCFKRGLCNTEFTLLRVSVYHSCSQVKSVCHTSVTKSHFFATSRPLLLLKTSSIPIKFQMRLGLAGFKTVAFLFARALKKTEDFYLTLNVDDDFVLRYRLK